MIERLLELPAWRLKIITFFKAKFLQTILAGILFHLLRQKRLSLVKKYLYLFERTFYFLFFYTVHPTRLINFETL